LRQLGGQLLAVSRQQNTVALHQNQRGNGLLVACVLPGQEGFGNLAISIALKRQQRVNNPMHHAAAAIDRHGDRVHQEGHVIVNNLNDRLLTVKTVFGQGGVVHVNTLASDIGRSVQQMPVRRSQCQQRGRTTLLQFIGIGIVKVGGHEVSQRRGGGTGVFQGVSAQVGKGGMSHAGLRLRALDTADSRKTKWSQRAAYCPIHLDMQESHDLHHQAQPDQTASRQSSAQAPDITFCSHSAAVSVLPSVTTPARHQSSNSAGVAVNTSRNSPSSSLR